MNTSGSKMLMSTGFLRNRTSRPRFRCSGKVATKGRIRETSRLRKWLSGMVKSKTSFVRISLPVLNSALPEHATHAVDLLVCNSLQIVSFASRLKPLLTVARWSYSSLLVLFMSPSLSSVPLPYTLSHVYDLGVFVYLSQETQDWASGRLRARASPADQTVVVTMVIRWNHVRCLTSLCERAAFVPCVEL
jgi:hypothetical protein